MAKINQKVEQPLLPCKGRIAAAGPASHDALGSACTATPGPASPKPITVGAEIRNLGPTACPMLQEGQVEGGLKIGHWIWQVGKHC